MALFGGAVATAARDLAPIRTPRPRPSPEPGLARSGANGREQRRALSSVGRASRLHREGRRFEPVSAHQPLPQGSAGKPLRQAAIRGADQLHRHRRPGRVGDHRLALAAPSGRMWSLSPSRPIRRPNRKRPAGRGTQDVAVERAGDSPRARAARARSRRRCDSRRSLPGRSSRPARAPAGGGMTTPSRRGAWAPSWSSIAATGMSSRSRQVTSSAASTSSAAAIRFSQPTDTVRAPVSSRPMVCGVVGGRHLRRPPGASSGAPGAPREGG